MGFARIDWDPIQRYFRKTEGGIFLAQFLNDRFNSQNEAPSYFWIFRRLK